MLEIGLFLAWLVVIFLRWDYLRYKKRRSANAAHLAPAADASEAPAPKSKSPETLPLEREVCEPTVGRHGKDVLPDWPQAALGAQTMRLVLAPRWRTLAIFSAMFLFYLVSSRFNHLYVYPNYVYLAYAWLHGSISYPHDLGAGIDDVLFNGRWYLVQAPLPAVIMLPLTLFFGLHANQEVMCAVCAAVAVAAVDTMLGRMNIEARSRLWTLLIMAFGTVFWWCASYGAVWMFGHVAAVMFLCLMLAEWYGLRRPWLIGLLFTCAALCRLPTMLAVLPFIAWLLLEEKDGLRKIGLLLVGALPLFALFAIYNFARWGTVLDIGYLVSYRAASTPSSKGPFGLSYLTSNLHGLFVKPPHFFKFDTFGTALTFTSPALFIALKAPRTRETAYLSIATILASLPALLYFNSGGMQFGMRYSLNFLPFLLPLLARGIMNTPTVVYSILTAYSIIINALGVLLFSSQQ